MKTIAWNRVIIAAGTLGLIIYLIISILTADKQNNVICKHIDVKIVNDGKLVYPEDIVSLIETKGITGVGKQLNAAKLQEVKEFLETKSYLRNILVYQTGDSVLHVEFEQRIPVVRLLNEKESLYLDSEGFGFPTSARYTYDVPLVTGNIQFPEKGTVMADSTFLRKLLDFAGFVAENPFWNAQIQQINIVKNKNVEFIVCSDNHCVRLGQLSGYKDKMNNLYAFYKKINPSKQGVYKILDLRFDKQIVAVKNNLNI